MYSVLIVDDEPMLRQATEVLIRQTQLPVSEIALAGDGVEAIEILSEKRFDILLIDIRMPRMNGLELCKYLHTKSPNTHLIILSGYGEFKYAQEAMKYGVEEYILKPVTREALTEALCNVISKIEEHNRTFSISFSQIDEIVALFENGLWDADDAMIDETLKKADELLKGIALLNGITICKNIIELLSGRISLKLGTSVYFPTDGFLGSDRDDLMKKFSEEIYSIKDEVISIRQNLKVNILQNALEIINEQYNTEITLNTLADSIGYNASYLSYLFKKLTGETFVQYKNRLRIEHAAKLLESTDLPITEIALEVGYGDTSYFTQAFKKYYNETPKSYRGKRRETTK